MRSRRKKYWKNLLLNVLWWAALVCFLVSAGMLAAYQLKTGSEKSKMNALAAVVQQAKTEPTEAAEDADATVLAQYGLLAQKNPDLVGWLSLEGTTLNYPVMQTAQDAPEYYLRRDFDKAYSLSGTPFADARCNVQADAENIIVYGHNMKNKTMFSTLEQYQSKDYLETHPYVQFDTLVARHRYRVFAVLVVDTDVNNPDALAAYQLLQGADEATYNAYVSYLKANSLYATDQTPVYGDSLLTLSTCTNAVETERLVVVAVRVP